VIQIVRGQGDVPIAVDDSGGTAPPVLFVHGFAHQRGVWGGLIARITTPLRAIAPDLRGHGESGWSVAGEYAVDHHALDLGRVLDELALDRVTIVAHSLGGNAATLTTAAHPDRVAGLILVDTGPGLSVAGLQWIAAGAAAPVRSYARRDEYRATLQATHPLADPTQLDRLTDASLVRRVDGRYEARLDPAVLRGPVDPGVIADVEERLWRALAAVRCRTLVVRGAKSAMLPAAVANRMVDEVLDDAELRIVERAGHSIMLDAEAELAALIDGFLAARRPPRRHDLPRIIHGPAVY
jgi:pimeloyl-ACP methyl ester carboxylesterase